MAAFPASTHGSIPSKHESQGGLGQALQQVQHASAAQPAAPREAEPACWMVRLMICMVALSATVSPMPMEKPWWSSQ